jgi:hypothetical protein
MMALIIPTDKPKVTVGGCCAHSAKPFWLQPVHQRGSKRFETVSGNGKERVIVDPAVQEEEDAFERMMERFSRMTREEHIRFGVERGVLNPDGTPKPLKGDPCVTLVSAER